MASGIAQTVALQAEDGTLTARFAQVLTFTTSGISRLVAFQAAGLLAAYGVPETLPGPLVVNARR